MLNAKLHSPTLSAHIVRREKLMLRLRRSQECKLTVITAPAGYGKTTSVLSWLGECGLPYAWLSLDGQDNDPWTFWRYVCASLEGVTDRVRREVEHALSSQELMQSGAHIDILIDRLSEGSSDFLLVLDDFHRVSNPAILTGLSRLIDYMPARMHLILIGRNSLETDLTRHRIRWQAERLEEEDLRFDQEEILQFYQARGYRLQDDLSEVALHTEGWAAAMVAVALSMNGAGRSNDIITALERSNRDIDQYLEDEVIGTWVPAVRAFAMKTSILDTLSAPLCDAVTGDNNGKSMLREIKAGSGFLIALDDQEQEYRYHHLLSNLLRKLLLEADAEEIPGLHARAGEWYRKQGLMPQAIEHFLSGGAHQDAFDLIEYQTDYLIHKTDFGRLLSWTKRLPKAYADKGFKIAAIHALYYAEVGEFDLSRQWIDRMKVLKDDRHHGSSPEWKGYSEISSALVEANLYVRQGSSEYLPLLLRLSEAEGSQYYKMPEYNDFNVSDIYFLRCPINQIVHLFREGSEQYDRMTAAYRRTISQNPGYAPLAVGEYLYESNRMEEALPYLLQAMKEASEAGCAGALVPAMADIARLKRATGDMAGAFAVLEECERQLKSIDEAHWRHLLAAFRCRLYLDIGETDRVREWFFASKLGTLAGINRAKEFELLIYARVLATMNRPQDAQLLLQRLLAFARETGRLHSQVEVLNVLALLSFQAHHTRLALKYLDESLSIGLNEDYARSYLDELVPMAQLLRAYIKSRRRQPEDQPAAERKTLAASLLNQMRDSLLQTAKTQHEVAAEVAQRVIEQLTQQERRVLELLLNADTNAVICEKLKISLRTVKTHTGNIYSKLGVKNRVQCVKVVQELGLL